MAPGYDSPEEFQYQFTKPHIKQCLRELQRHGGDGYRAESATALGYGMTALGYWYARGDALEISKAAQTYRNVMLPRMAAHDLLETRIRDTIVEIETGANGAPPTLVNET